VQHFVFTLEFSLKPTTAFSTQQKTAFSLFHAVQILSGANAKIIPVVSLAAAGITKGYLFN